MKTKQIAYWPTTAFLAFTLVSGAVGELTQQWGTIETATILGYPTYFLTIIGMWKLAGAVALLIPGFPRLKEWAYAGIFFNMTGAFVSHAAVGDYGAYAYHLVATGSIVLLAIVSWALRPRDRSLYELNPARGWTPASAAFGRMASR